MSFRRTFLTFACTTSLLTSSALPALAASEPTVGTLNSLQATSNIAQTFTTSYSDPDGVTSCSFFVDGVNKGAMSLSGTNNGIATFSHTFNDVGSYQVQIRCKDPQNNEGLGTTGTVTVTATQQGTTGSAPTVGAITPNSVTLNSAQTFEVGYAGTGVNNCSLYVDGAIAGNMTLANNTSSTGTASFTHTFTSSGNHTLQARCSDAQGNTGVGTITDVNVSSSTSGNQNQNTGNDTTPPSSPLNFIQGTSSTPGVASFSWNAATDNVGVVSYEYSVDNQAFVNIGNGTSLNTPILPNGPHTITLRARDAAGNVSNLSSLSFFVDAQTQQQQPTPISVRTTPPFELTQMSSDADLTLRSTARGDFETASGRTCELLSDNAALRAKTTFGTITDAAARGMIENFTACGTGTMMHLGAGERLGVIASYRAAFGRFPMTQSDWYDVMKIGNGRFPGQVSASAEASAKESFRKVYLREPNMSIASDNNAVVVMAYGLRPLPRNLNAERAAIGTFVSVYKRQPTSTRDWDIVRAIAYSGATR